MLLIIFLVINLNENFTQIHIFNVSLNRYIRDIDHLELIHLIKRSSTKCICMLYTSVNIANVLNI